MHAELQVTLEGLFVSLGVVEERHPRLMQQQAQADGGGGSGGSDGQQQAQQGQQEMAPDLEDTLRQLREATSRNSLESAAALQRQLAAALAAAGAGGQRPQAHAPHYEVHQWAELRLQQLQVSSGLVAASPSWIICGARYHAPTCALAHSSSRMHAHWLAFWESVAGMAVTARHSNNLPQRTRHTCTCTRTHPKKHPRKLSPAGGRCFRGCQHCRGGSGASTPLPAAQQRSCAAGGASTGARGWQGGQQQRS